MLQTRYVPAAWLSTGLTALLLFQTYPSCANAQQTAGKLNITIVEGDGAINNVRQRVNREVIVEVQDENHKPVAGAAVTFFLPNQGPTGVFSNGGRSLTTLSDSSGRAAARGLRLNHMPGRMEIRVTATSGQRRGEALISQTNILPAAAVMSTKLILLLAVAGAGAAAAGAILATRGGGASAATPNVIVPGTPTVGGGK